MKLDLCTLIAFSVAVSVPMGTAAADVLCPRMHTDFVGNVSSFAPMSAFETAVSRSESEELPIVSVPFSSKELGTPAIFQFRFVRTDDKSWAVETRSGTSAERVAAAKFYGPVATIDFDGAGRQRGHSELSLYVPQVDTDSGPIELSFGFDQLGATDGPSVIEARTVIESAQECPVFGKVVLTAEQAKVGPNRQRLFDPQGIEVTDSGFDELGSVANR
jgi:hypothetical protein